MDNASDRKSIRAKEKAARIAAAERQSVTRELMSTIAGRKWIWDLLSSCHIFASTYQPTDRDSAFAEGERNIGLNVLADIMLACPDQYIQAQRESNERDATDERRRSAQPNRRDSGSSAEADGDPEDGYYNGAEANGHAGH